MKPLFIRSVMTAILLCATAAPAVLAAPLEAAEKPASGRLMLRVDPKVHAAAVKASAQNGQSLNKWAEQVLMEAARA